MVKKILNNEFVRNVLTLMAGSGFAQIIPLLAAPVIARLFTPDEIGIFAFYFSLVIIVSNVASGRYEPSIAIAETDEEALNLTAFSIALSFFVSVLSLLVLFVVQQYYSLFDGLIAEAWAYLIPILIWITSVYKSLRYLAIRNKKFRPISLSAIFQSSFRAGGSILLGFLGFGPSGLIIGGIAGRVSSLITILIGTKKHMRGFKKKVQLSKIKKLANQYSKFPKYDLPATLSHTLGSHGTVVLILKFFSERTAGLYSYTERVLITPVSLFSASFAQVFLQKIATTYHEDKEKFRNLVIATFNRFVWYSLIPFVIFTWSTKYLVPIIFGPDWIELYKYIWVLSPYILLVMAFAPLREVFYIINKQEKLMFLQFNFFVLRFSALIIGYVMGYSPLVSIYIFSIASSVSYLMNIFIVLNLLKVRQKVSWLLLVILITFVFVVLNSIVS